MATAAAPPSHWPMYPSSAESISHAIHQLGIVFDPSVYERALNKEGISNVGELKVLARAKRQYDSVMAKAGIAPAHARALYSSLNVEEDDGGPFEDTRVEGYRDGGGSSKGLLRRRPGGGTEAGGGADVVDEDIGTDEANGEAEDRCRRRDSRSMFYRSCLAVVLLVVFAAWFLFSPHAPLATPTTTGAGGEVAAPPGDKDKGELAQPSPQAQAGDAADKTVLANEAAGICQQATAVLHDMTIVGFDLKKTKAGETLKKNYKFREVGECCALCAGTSECSSVSWMWPKPAQEFSRCWLHKKSPSLDSEIKNRLAGNKRNSWVREGTSVLVIR